MAKHVFDDFNAHRYGRNGQTQRGIDICANDHRSKRGTIVIQCKFLAKPDTSKAPTDLIDELKRDYRDALENHSFDEFIFASTFPDSTQLTEAAKALTAQYGKRVNIWSQKDLDDAVKAHPRLQRLFAGVDPISGVTLIDQDFLDNLVSISTNPFQFYAGVRRNHTQWAGIVQEFDAPRQVRAAVDARVDLLFGEPALDSRVAAVVLGDGGSGKSTLLRRIAVDRARVGACVCWWVVRTKDFLDFDRISIEESHDLRHLIFIDDWYENVRNDDDASAFFLWLTSTKKNVLVLIGDRKETGRAYMQHLYGRGKDNLYSLLPAENKSIVGQVINVLRKNASDALVVNVESYLVERAPLFIVLFVLSYELQILRYATDVDFSDGITRRFQKIITNKLLELERTRGYCGYAQALTLLGEMCVVEGSPWPVFSEDTLVSMAAFFADSKGGVSTRSLSANYPAALSALIHREVTSQGVALCRFNHAVIAEHGLVGVAARTDVLTAVADHDDETLHALLDYLIKHRAARGAALVWHWLVRRGTFDVDLGVQTFISVLERCAELSYRPAMETMLRAFQLPEARELASITLMKDVDLLLKLGPSVCPMLIDFGSQDIGRNTAEAILNRDDLAQLPSEIVATALKILPKLAAGATAAQGILKAANFLKLNPKVQSLALTAAGNSGVARSVASDILAQPNLVTQPFGLVVESLKVLEHHYDGKSAAERILQQQDMSTFSHQVIGVALTVAPDKNVVRAAALRILDQADRLPHVLQFNALRVLVGDLENKIRPRVSDFVKRVLTDTARGPNSTAWLRDQLLLLPYSWVSEHRGKVLSVAKSYRPTNAIVTKKRVQKVLCCRLEYGIQHEVEAVVSTLCEFVVAECVVDIDHQWRNHSQDLFFQHISAAAGVLGAFVNVLAVERVNDIVKTNRTIEKEREFKKLIEDLVARRA